MGGLDLSYVRIHFMDTRGQSSHLVNVLDDGSFALASDWIVETPGKYETSQSARENENCCWIKCVTFYIKTVSLLFTLFRGPCLQRALHTLLHPLPPRFSWWPGASMCPVLRTLRTESHTAGESGWRSGNCVPLVRGRQGLRGWEDLHNDSLLAQIPVSQQHLCSTDHMLPSYMLYLGWWHISTDHKANGDTISSQSVNSASACCL